MQERRDNWVAAWDRVHRIEERIELRKQQVARLEKKRQRAYDDPDIKWVDALVRPLAADLAGIIGAAEYEVIGPQGLGSRVTLIFYDSPVPVDEYGRKKWMEVEEPRTFLTILPDDLPNLCYETGERTVEYLPGTIGEMNGMNNVTAPLPDSIDEVAEIIRSRRQGVILSYSSC
jgi:hypothetical protein